MQVETCRRHPIASEHHGDVDVTHHTTVAHRSSPVSPDSRMQDLRAVGSLHGAKKKFRLDRGGFADDAKGIDMGISKGQDLTSKHGRLLHHRLPTGLQLHTRLLVPLHQLPPEPLWRDSKPGPSRLHSPLTASASPFLASPSPSPIDEDDDEQYDPMDDAQDELELGLDLQFCASPEFVAFMPKLLENTQVSQSVIVLSLHYIFRLKERNDFTLGKPGSEFRVAVCALMLANKFVDDNTYTNKTWSDVSAIPLDELNKMEREFLLGSGLPLPPHPRAPLLPDAALEVFTRISQPDSNRKIISSSVPQQWLWRLFEALVHRLPTDHDYKLVIREESWMSYLEKLVLDLYLLAFLMPPEMK
ncbi:hypothetical protein DFH11DRAFT_1732290 [Phellopilus nigrolimitatus]|nr:hypothetical protein DFH11DRAFT_1732290 [Phellopilus nigrolimitatus]